MPLTRPTLTYIKEIGVRDGSSPMFSLSENEAVYTRKFRIPWDQVHLAGQFFLGYSKIDRDGTGAPVRLMRLNPMACTSTTDSGFSYMFYATSVRVLGNHVPYDRAEDATKTDTGTVTDQTYKAVWKSVDIEVEYRQPRYRITADGAGNLADESKRHVEHVEIKPRAEILSLPYGSISLMKGGAATSTVNQNVPIKQPSAEFTLKWWDLPSDLFDLDADTPTPWQERVLSTNSARTYLHTVNKTAFKGFQPWTLLLEDVRLTRRPAVVYSEDYYVQYKWDVEFVFYALLTPGGHNHLVAPWNEGADYRFASRKRETPTLRAAGSLPDGEGLYDEREFVDLFKVQA